MKSEQEIVTARTRHTHLYFCRLQGFAEKNSSACSKTADPSILKVQKLSPSTDLNPGQKLVQNLNDLQSMIFEMILICLKIMTVENYQCPKKVLNEVSYGML